MNTSNDTIPTNQKRWLNPKELYEEYGFTESNQAKLRMRRVIPFSKMGNYIRYDRYEIDRWIESNKVDVVA
jgi:predicted DNA-binding transcriptional regulator AlpA